MAEIQLTVQQQEVINNRGGALLVSAAAGSGKTRVLIDRVLKRVAEEQCNVDDFLMITFTQAAAAELRGKLIARLSEKLADCPNDRHLQQQMSRVYSAQISTVHSFCSSLLREYTHLLDLPVDFRLCDEQETDALRERVMDKLLEDAYTRKNEDITAAVDMLGAGRDDRKLPKQILKCCDLLSSSRNRDAALEKLLRQWQEENLTIAPWLDYLFGEWRRWLEGCLQSMDRACELIEQTPCLQGYAPMFLEFRQMLRDLYSTEKREDLRKVPLEKKRLATIRNCTEKEKQTWLKDLRESIWKELHSRLDRLCGEEESMLEDVRATAPAVRGLLELTKEFLSLYSAEKRRRHVLDYNDLEQETLRLLYRKGTTPTAEAREISKRFVELMIDEYQDTNEVQDAIFYGISRNGQNLFFVGDVKQSIYRFRQADPEIFLEKYRSYKNYEDAEEGEPRKILLSDNFRSVKPILDAANDVFYLTMTRRVGGLRYTEAEALRANAKELPEGAAVELHCIDLSAEGAEAAVKREEIEAEFTARRIAKMLQGETVPQGEGHRPILPEDIAILMRAPAGKAAVYQSALARYGIASSFANEDLFDTEEIRFLCALLQVIDNPHQDIPLLTVLFSPVVRFSPDVLAFLRGKQKEGDLWELLAECEEAEQLRAMLLRLRRSAQRGSLHALMDDIDEVLSLRQTYPMGQENLDSFLTLVDGFEGGGHFGLSAFLRQVQRWKEDGVKNDDTGRKGVVQILSVHKSKGLEYPVVFLTDLCKEFNQMDARETVLFDTELGMGTRLIDGEHAISYPTVAHSAISHRICRENRSEEMRMLYVAMTRPRYRLIMTCCKKNLLAHIESLAHDLSVPARDAQIEGAKSQADWVLMTALTHIESGTLCSESGIDRKVSEFPWLMQCHAGGDYLPGAPVEQEEQTQERTLPPLQPVSYAYPVAAVTPAKLTATQLKGGEELQELAPALRFSKPRFDRRGLSATERGTAIHLAMQYLSYAACDSLTGVQGELRRLVEQRFLTLEQAEAVPPLKLLRFFQSELGQRVLAAKKLVREFKFSVLEDAGQYDAELTGEQLLLQGVTDCCVMEEDGLLILDFKSDRIKQGEEAERAEHYRGQMDAYSRALSRIFDLSVKERILYFFATDTAYYL